MHRTHDRVIRKATSGAMGEFTVPGLSDRPGVLLLDKQGFARTVIPGVRAGAGAQTFELATGAAVEGTVRTLKAEPVAGVRARASVGGQSFPATLTGEDGTYRLEDLPEGDATVSFEMPPSSGPTIRRQVKVSLKSGRTAAADLVIATGSIAGTLSRHGVPVREANVLVSPKTGGSEWFLTDARGRFQAEALPAGPYEVRVENLRQGGALRQVGLVRKVEVGGGEMRCDIDLAATLVSGRVVRGGTGEPMRGAHVALYNTDGWVYAEATCAPAEDRFDLEAPGTGTFYLAVSAAKGGEAAGWLGPLLVEEGVGLRDLALPLGGAASISVLVLDSAAGRPVEGASATLSAPGGFVFRAAAATDASGQARLADLPAGEYRLEVDAEGHLPRAADLEVGSTETERTFELERASRIVVELEGGRGTADGMCVEATVIEGGDPGWLECSVGGESSRPRSFKCSGPRSPPLSKVSFKARAGRYRIRFVAIAPRTRPLSDPRNTVEEVEVTVPEGGEASVRLGTSER